MPPPQTKRPKDVFAQLEKMEAERVAVAVAVPVVSAAGSSLNVGSRGEMQGDLAPALSTSDVEQRLDAVWVGIVECQLPFLDALRQNGISTREFFRALGESNDVRTWYRDLNGARSLLKVEDIAKLMDELEEAADETSPLGNGVRNAKIGKVKVQLDQTRWESSRFLAALGFGEKPSESHSKVEIVVRRETKKAVQEAIDDE